MFNTTNIKNLKLALISNEQTNLSSYIQKIITKNRENPTHQPQLQIKLQDSSQLISDSHHLNVRSDTVSQNKHQQLDISQNYSYKNQEEIKQGTNWISKVQRHNPRKAIIQEDQIIAYRIRGSKGNRDKIAKFNSSHTKGYISNQLFQQSRQKHRHILKNNHILIKSQNLEQLNKQLIKEQLMKNQNRGLISYRNNQRYRQNQQRFLNSSAQIGYKKHLPQTYHNFNKKLLNHNKHNIQINQDLQRNNDQIYYNNPQEASNTKYKNQKAKYEDMKFTKEKKLNGFLLQQFQVPYREDQHDKKYIVQRSTDIIRNRGYINSKNRMNKYCNHPGYIHHFSEQQNKYQHQRKRQFRQNILFKEQKKFDKNQDSRENKKAHQYYVNENNQKQQYLNLKFGNKNKERSSFTKPFELQQTISFQKPLQKHYC